MANLQNAFIFIIELHYGKISNKIKVKVVIIVHNIRKKKQAQNVRPKINFITNFPKKNLWRKNFKAKIVEKFSANE